MLAANSTAERAPRKPVPLQFDPDRRAKHAGLKDAAYRLANFLQQRERELHLRSRSRTSADAAKFCLAVEALACNLVVHNMLHWRAPLAVPRSNKAMWSGSPDDSPVYGAHFTAALDVLSHPDVGLLSLVQKGYRYAGSEGQTSTYLPTLRLLEWLPGEGAAFAWFYQRPSSFLLLKTEKIDGRSQAILFEETQRTAKLRRQVVSLNKRLAAIPLFIEQPEDELGVGDDGQPIDTSQRALRRIFNNKSWTEGGRLFGGFWETMPREQRFGRLRIGTGQCPSGEEVANVDFGQLYPRLAYVMRQQKAPAGDLYDVSGDGTSRAGWKKLFNALLFAKELPTRWPRETSRLFPAGTKLQSVIELLREKHQAISSAFGSGIGFKLMFFESEILLEALEALSHEGINALPLHDSVLVGRSEANAALEVLSEIYMKHTGEPRAHIKIDIGE